MFAPCVICYHTLVRSDESLWLMFPVTDLLQGYSQLASEFSLCWAAVQLSAKHRGGLVNWIITIVEYH